MKLTVDRPAPNKSTSLYHIRSSRKKQKISEWNKREGVRYESKQQKNVNWQREQIWKHFERALSLSDSFKSPVFKCNKPSSYLCSGSCDVRAVIFEFLL